MRKIIFVVLLGLLLPTLALAQERLTSEQIEAIAERVVLIFALDRRGDPISSGTGTIISAQGTIITNRHVVSEGEDFAILMIDDIREAPEVRYFASVIGVAPEEELDLAVMQIDRDERGDEIDPNDLDLPFLELMAEPTVTLGDSITIFGFPGIADGRLVVTQGSITTIENGDVGRERVELLYLTDAEISPGNSGGLAVNSAGQFIGIPTFVSSEERTGGRLGGILTSQAALLVIRDDTNLVSLEDWRDGLTDRPDNNDGGGNRDLVGGIEIDCGRDGRFNNGVEFRFPELPGGIDYTATVIGVDDFDPILAIFPSGQADEAECADDSREARGYEISLPTSGDVTGSETSARLEFTSGRRGGDMSLVVGGYEDMEGDFVLVIEGLELPGSADYGTQVEVSLTPGMVGRGTALTSYMFHVTRRLDPLLFLHDGAGEVVELDNNEAVQCDDAGNRRNCWGDSEDLRDSFVTRINGRAQDGSDVDAMLSLPVDGLEEVVSGREQIYLYLALSSADDEGEYIAAFHTGTR